MEEQNSTTPESQANAEAYAEAVASVYGDVAANGSAASTEPKPAESNSAPAEEATGTQGSDNASEQDEGPGDAPGSDQDAPGTEADPGGDPSDLKRHAVTTTGRLRATQEELAAVKTELEQLRAAKPAAPEVPPLADAPKPVEIPDALKSDAAEFDELEPKLGPLLRDPGPLGEALRKTLDKFGAVPAAQQARLAVLEHELMSLKQERVSETNSAVVQAHRDAIVSQHPEVKGLFSKDPVESAKARRFKTDVELWVLESKSDPEERAAAMDILVRGKAADVNLLLSEYKKTLSESRSAGISDDAKHRAALAGGIDNKRSPKPKAPQVEPRVAAIQAVYGK